ncbi:OmpW/AlkL family protein [Solimicrobium silvestre]|uniref:Outer membrane protein W n=1 Tax=Solimicrobium silvestre TaxID=2099400 RepID=A0A2S9H4X9_9BURK|nr:OmpW family outer membrane protein [Solimicrobium silvestre]PRC95045.1 Outer membrane protein W [Solimicrobium silvestre]
MKKIVKLMGCALLLSASAGAMAQEAGTIMVKAGYAYFDPVVSSGNLSAPSLPGTKMDVGTAGTLLLTGTYMFTDHISAEFYGGIPLKHDIYGAGSIQGVGVIGTVKQLPPTLFGQYRFFETSSNFRPYLGLGVTYVHFEDETGNAVLTAITNPGGSGTTFKVKDAWGVVPQAGITSWINKQWYIDISVNKSFVKTTTTLSTGQTIATALNPVVTQASIGYRF